MHVILMNILYTHMYKGSEWRKNEPGKTRERVRERFVLDEALLHIGSC